MDGGAQRIADLLMRDEGEISRAWVEEQRAGMLRAGRLSEQELQRQARAVLRMVRDAVQTPEYEERGIRAVEGAKGVLQDLTTGWLARGISTTDVARFVLSLKRPLFNRMRQELESDPAALGLEIWRVGELLDALALYVMEFYSKENDAVIQRQQRELLELSTPVVRLWDNILVLPLIGTLDSSRTQILMQSLLEQFASTGSNTAIIDITGVPTVDTLVAQHLLRTVEAARLMGAECIISGIRPQIAQTIVQLGVELNVQTRALLADALKLALANQGMSVVRNGA